MAKVTGIGGVFFKAADKAAMRRFLDEGLGLPTAEWGRVFRWRELEEPGREGCTVLSVHSEASDYFDPSPHRFLVNLRVDDLEGLLARLREQGHQVVKVFEPQPNGLFAHVMGPEGVMFELWQPLEDEASDA